MNTCHLITPPPDRLTLGWVGVVSCRRKSEKLFMLMPARGLEGGASNTILITGMYTSLRLNRELLKCTQNETKIMASASHKD